jgi:hypothetical protein
MRAAAIRGLLVPTWALLAAICLSHCAVGQAYAHPTADGDKASTMPPLDDWMASVLSSDPAGKFFQVPVVLGGKFFVPARQRWLMGQLSSGWVSYAKIHFSSNFCSTTAAARHTRCDLGGGGEPSHRHCINTAYASSLRILS